MLWIVLKWVGLVLATLVIVVIGFVTIARITTYFANRITSEHGIDESVYVPLGGQEQYLRIRGKDRGNPVIVWLHGGPGGPDGFLYHVFSKYLVADYTIVSWDQRGCGKTYYHNRKTDPINETVSFPQAMEDLDQLVDYVRERFEVGKVILVGHSYGTMPGSKYALENPLKVAAYIGIGQVVTMESEIYSYQDALAKARDLGRDTKAMEDAYKDFMAEKSLLNKVNLRRFVYPYHIPPKQANQIWLALLSPYLGVDNIRWFLKANTNVQEYIKLNQPLFDYLDETDVRDYGLEYQVPVGFISGSEDWSTPVKYVEDYYEMITAPKKSIYQLKDCGHSPQMDAPEEFCKVLKGMLEEYLN